jgi:hypothetical protein
MTESIRLAVFERENGSTRVIDETTVATPDDMVAALDRFNSEHGLAQTAHRWVEAAKR